MDETEQNNPCKGHILGQLSTLGLLEPQGLVSCALGNFCKVI
jgi:hypothetical protein